MKLTLPLLAVGMLAACALIAPRVRAGTACPDDPERCVERGAAVAHAAGVATCCSQSHVVPAPATTAVTVSARKPALVAQRKSISKPARVTPVLTTATPATPGMGMLLKLSSGSGGDVSLFSSRPVENSGTTWVL